MSWFILKDRRHLGPFNESQLKKYFQRNEIGTQDFLISVEKAEKGELLYVRVSDCFPKWAIVTEAAQNAKPEIKVPKNDRAMGSFSEDEILKSEVSRVFMESLDSVDLMKGSHELTKTGVTSLNGPKKPPKAPTFSRLNPTQNSNTIPISPQQEEATGAKKRTHQLLMIVSSIFMFVVLASFPFLDKTAIPSREPTSEKTQGNSNPPSPASDSKETFSTRGSGKINKSPTIKVPELTDERTRRLEMEREREQERRDREMADERENRDRRSPTPEPAFVDKNAETEMDPLDERETLEDPKSEDENAENFDEESPGRRAPKKAPQENEENI